MSFCETDFVARDSDDGNDLFEMYVEVVRSTDKALLVIHEDEEFWLPWSQVETDCIDGDEGDEGLIRIPLGLARKKGLA